MGSLFVIAAIAGQRVAFPAGEVESVVEIGPVVPVPGAARHVAGLAALRSRVVTVIGCRAALDPDAEPAATRDAIVTVQAGHAYALLVDLVEDVVESDGQIEAPPPGLEPGWARVASGLVSAGGELFLVVDAAALAAGAEAAPLNRPLTLAR